MRKLLLNLNLSLFFILICSCSDAEQATPTPAPTVMPDAKAVLVRTDKTEYQQGEVVKLWVKNNLDAPLWYAREAECGLSFWLARDCEKPLPEFEGACLWEMPQHDFTRLGPGQVLQDDGARDRREGEWYALELSEPGCYIIVFPYSLVEMAAMGSEWEPDRLEALSDEFIIKP